MWKEAIYMFGGSDTGGAYAPVPDDARAARTRVAGLVLAVLVSLGVLAGAGARARSSPALAAAAGTVRSGSGAACAPTGVEDYVACTHDGSAFLAIESIRDDFASRGVSDEDALGKFLPKSWTATYSPSRTGAAAGARTAFSLYLPEVSLATYASYLVVANADGSLAAAAPTTTLDDGDASTHFDAIKLMTPTRVLAYSNVWDAESGRPYAWDWRTSAPEAMNDVVATSSHDVQLCAANTGGPDDAYWSPGLVGIKRTRVRDGRVLANYAMEGCEDVNHAQLLADDAIALVSCRDSNAIILYDVAAKSILWVAGGNASTLTLIGEDGAKTDALWHGQHNAEAFGDDLIYLFDNAQGAPDPTPSSIKRVRVDAEAGTATLEWSHALIDAYPGALPYPSGYSEVFGDADLLPNGDVLTTWWPRHLQPTADLEFDVQIAQISEDKDVSWSLEFTNTGHYPGTCVDDPDPGCERIIRTGWKIYSAERFYDAPLITSVSLEKAAAGGATLAFSTHAALKRSGSTAGRWELADGDGVVKAAGAFSFAPHFLRTVVSADAPTLSDIAGLTLSVSDEWDNRREAAVEPTAGRRF